MLFAVVRVRCSALLPVLVDVTASLHFVRNAKEPFRIRILALLGCMAPSTAGHAGAPPLWVRDALVLFFVAETAGRVGGFAVLLAAPSRGLSLTLFQRLPLVIKEARLNLAGGIAAAVESRVFGRERQGPTGRTGLVNP